MYKLRYDGKDTITRIGPDGGVLSHYELLDVRQVSVCKHRGMSLNVLAFSDWRVQDIDRLIRDITSDARPDLIIYAGDDVERFRANGRNYFEQLAGLSKFGLCAVAGNDEDPDARSLIAGVKVFAVHSHPLVIGNFAVVGLEGAPILPGGTSNIGSLLYPRSFRGKLMVNWTRKFVGKKLIIVSHAPPHGVLDFAIRYSRNNIGCPALRQFLEAYDDAILCVCGHVHRQGGQSETAGNAVVVNAASHDRIGDAGKVARIQIRGGQVKTADIHWRELAGNPKR